MWLSNTCAITKSVKQRKQSSFNRQYLSDSSWKSIRKWKRRMENKITWMSNKSCYILHLFPTPPPKNPPKVEGPLFGQILNSGQHVMHKRSFIAYFERNQRNGIFKPEISGFNLSNVWGSLCRGSLCRDSQLSCKKDPVQTIPWLLLRYYRITSLIWRSPWGQIFQKSKKL